MLCLKSGKEMGTWVKIQLHLCSPLCTLTICPSKMPGLENVETRDILQ